eukprot:1303350-Alexandrium_andersonii.AAC.1
MSQTSLGDSAPSAGSAVLRTAVPAVGSALRGVSDFRRFQAAGRRAWPAGHAGTAAPLSGWI